MDNILISRTDRAGDLVLTLPVFCKLKKEISDIRLTAHVRSYTAPLLKDQPYIDSILLDDMPKGQRPSLLRLAYMIRQRNFTAAIIVHPAPRAILACWLARVPVRIGRASNIWQVFLTHRIIQNRSRNEHHEAWYNLDLANKWLACKAAAKHQDKFSPDQVDLGFLNPPLLYVTEIQRNAGRAALRQAGLGETKPVLVHPGHGGSAVNLPISGYRKLVDRLLKRGHQVALSLGPDERNLALEFPPPIPGKFGIIDNAQDLSELLGVISCCKAFFGGSTGPMHMAAALGLFTIAFFPLLPAMTPKRWGPLGKNCLIVQPTETSCPGSCIKCQKHNCLADVDVDSAISWLEDKLNTSFAFSTLD